MLKSVLVITFMIISQCTVPLQSIAKVAPEILEIDNSKIALFVSDNNIRVLNASGEILTIYNLTGMKVFSLKIESVEKSFQLNLSKGCYIVKIGPVVRKIYLH